MDIDDNKCENCEHCNEGRLHQQEEEDITRGLYFLVHAQVSSMQKPRTWSAD